MLYLSKSSKSCSIKLSTSHDLCLQFQWFKSWLGLFLVVLNLFFVPKCISVLMPDIGFFFRDPLFVFLLAVKSKYFNTHIAKFKHIYIYKAWNIRKKYCSFGLNNRNKYLTYKNLRFSQVWRKSCQHILCEVGLFFTAKVWKRH